MNLLTPQPEPTSSYGTDQLRWQALVQRDPGADGSFVYSVRSTGVYCRPVCPSRLALRKNVRFHATCEDAERAGYRPCRRCKPSESSLIERQAAIVERACRIIEETDEPLDLRTLADAVGVSPSHLQRTFKAQTGVTPKGYVNARRAGRLRDELSRSETVTGALYGAGYQSSSRFYESSNATLGMTATAFRAGGDGTTIRFAVGECWLGSILVAATDKGVCAILLGDNPDELARDLQDRFPNARLIGGDPGFELWMGKAVAVLETPSIGHELPLDIRGTAFQRRVWEALREIPAGETASYTEIAQRIGRPTSARAVAQACARNPVAVAIPCHRVVRTDGSLSGYRWGVERKSRLLQRERDTD